jgi:hypothetical protein
MNIPVQEKYKICVSNYLESINQTSDSIGMLAEVGIIVPVGRIWPVDLTFHVINLRCDW